MSIILKASTASLVCLLTAGTMGEVRASAQSADPHPAVTKKLVSGLDSAMKLLTIIQKGEDQVSTIKNLIDKRALDEGTITQLIKLGEDAADFATTNGHNLVMLEEQAGCGGCFARFSRSVKKATNAANELAVFAHFFEGIKVQFGDGTLQMVADIADKGYLGILNQLKDYLIAYREKHPVATEVINSAAGAMV